MVKMKIDKPVFVCFEFDNYKPWVIDLNKNKFNSTFMVPPGTWKCFFTTQFG